MTEIGADGGASAAGEPPSTGFGDALEATERRWQALVAASADMACIIGPRGRMTTATPGMLRFIGVDDLAALEGRVLETIHPDDRLRVMQTFREVATTAGAQARIDYRAAAAGGQWRWVEAIYTNHYDDPAVGGVVCNLRDITSRRQAEERARRAAFTDALTGLANRSGLQDAVSRATAGTVLCLLDLDGFKEINDGLGHEVGDLVLRTVGERLRDATRDVDTVARLGGDEFAVLAVGVGTEHQAEAVAEKLVSALADPVVVDGIRLRVAATAGVALESGPTAGASRLLRRADLALERARRRRLPFALWEPGDDPTGGRLALLADLHAALDAGTIDVAYQPKVDVATGAVVGVEALARWAHPTLGAVPPAEFVPLAERSALIRPLTHLVLQRALEQLKAWRAAGRDLTVAVNLSPACLPDRDLVDVVARQLLRTGVPAAALTLEITESAFAVADDVTITALHALHDLGVQLAVDDFGTGYSVLAYLKRLPIAELKIDREFVTDAARDERDRAIAASVIDLAHRLDMTVVGEGVEDQAAADVLAELGCDHAQGFHLGRPVPAADLTFAPPLTTG